MLYSHWFAWASFRPPARAGPQGSTELVFQGLEPRLSANGLTAVDMLPEPVEVGLLFCEEGPPGAPSQDQPRGAFRLRLMLAFLSLSPEFALDIIHILCYIHIWI